MDWQAGYYKDDLKIYINFIEQTKYKPYSLKIHRYRIFILLQGEADVFYNGETFRLKENQLIFTDHDISYGYSFVDEKSAKYLEIIIHPSVLKNTFDDEEFLRSLTKTPIDKRIIDLNNDNYISLRQNVNDIIKCIDHNFGRAHLLPRVYSMISELDLYFDEITGPKERVFQDNLPLTIIDYVNHNFTEKITYKTISEKFFVSKPTIIKIFKAFSGVTMHEYVKRLRLEAAVNLINDNTNIVTAAKMSGFEYYSTFLRAYKEKYNKFPGNSKNKNNKYPQL